MAKKIELGTVKGYYQLQECLAEEVLSLHFLATHTITQDTYFVFAYKKKFLSPDLVKNLIQVIQSLKEIRHPNMLPLEDFHYDGETFFVMYGIKNTLTPLDKYLEAHKDVSEGLLGKWCTQILSALMLLEGKSLCGGAINMGDLYIDSNQQIYLSKVVIQAAILAFSFDRLAAVDEGVFSPPELVVHQGYAIRSDMYSFGVLLQVLFGKTWPYPNTTKISEIKQLILEGPDPFYKRSITTPDYIEPVIDVCLRLEPLSRYQSIGMLLKALQAPSATSPPPPPPRERDDVLRKELEANMKQKKKQERRFIGSLATLAFLGLGALFLLYQGVIQYSTAIPETSVPMIYGMSLDHAHKQLEEADLIGEVAGERNSNLPKGTVVESKPPQGREVKQSRVIRLFISKGPAAFSTSSGSASANCELVTSGNETAPPIDASGHP